MLNWTIEKKIFKLRYNWKLSRNETSEKINFFVRVSDGIHEGIGEIAPNIRYNEDSISVLKDFDHFLSNPLNSFLNINDIETFIKNLSVSNAVRFGIESAAVHFLCKIKNTTVSDLLKLPVSKELLTCYTIPVMPAETISEFINSNNLDRFDSLKIKINKETGLDAIHELVRHTNRPIKIDANESWTDVDDFLIFTKKIKKLNIQFIEQPFPASFVEGYMYSKDRAGFELFADESIRSDIDFQSISKQFHGINMKLMKAGSYLQGLYVINEARKSGLKTMIGCMIESTLGISSAMNFGGLVDFVDLDGHFVIENEPFNLVTEKNGCLYLNN